VGGAGAWLEDRLFAGVPGSPARVAGTGFEAYARVLHPVSGRLLSWEDPGSGMVPRVVDERAWTWAAVASAIGVPFSPTLGWDSLGEGPLTVQGWEIDEPRWGVLDPTLLARIVPSLAASTGTPDDALVAIWSGWARLHPGSRHVLTAASEAAGAHGGAPRLPVVSAEVREVLESRDLLSLPGRDYVVLEGAVAELVDPDWGFRVGLGWDAPWREPTPQLVWPRDRAWVVASEVDARSTVVAGSRALVDAVLEVDGIEAVEVGTRDVIGGGWG